MQIRTTNTGFINLILIKLVDRAPVASAAKMKLQTQVFINSTYHLNARLNHFSLLLNWFEHEKQLFSGDLVSGKI